MYCLNATVDPLLFGNVNSVEYSEFVIQYLPCGSRFNSNSTSACVANLTESIRYLGTPEFVMVYNAVEMQQNKFGDESLIKNSRFESIQFDPAKQTQIASQI